MKHFAHLLILFIGAGVLLLVSGCKSTDFVEQPPPSDYPPPAIPVPEPAPSSPRTVVSRPPSGGSIRPGDTLELFVEEDDAFNGTYPVREQGDIIIPSVGRIQVAGLSVGSAGSRVETELESRHLKQATVILDRVGRAELPAETAQVTAPPTVPKFTIYLNGKVNRPGQHRIDLPKSGHLGVYEAILIAGGLSNFADPARVHLLRNDAEGKKRKIPVNIANIEKGLEKDPSIGDGDIVVVPEKVFGF